MSKIHSGIKKAYEYALTSTRACRHGAILSKSGKPIAFGINRRKTHPLSDNIYNWLHAEIDCVLKRGWEGVRGLELYVARAGRRGDIIANSKPCKSCQEFISNCGINTVYYSICDCYVGYWVVGKNKWGKIKLRKKISI